MVRAFIDSSHVLGKGSFADVFRGTYPGHPVEKGVVTVSRHFEELKILPVHRHKKIEEEVVVRVRLVNHGQCFVLDLCVKDR
jgi:hypothetical protein